MEIYFLNQIFIELQDSMEIGDTLKPKQLLLLYDVIFMRLDHRNIRMILNNKSSILHK